MRYFICIILLLNLFGCAACPSHKNKYTVSLTIDEPQRLRFSGKGAGAGMMLSSSMGPMGIAIGVAIDEGISKDIQSSFIDSGHSLDNLILSSFKAANEPLGNEKNNIGNLSGEIKIHIKSIGFKTTSGEGDPVIANILGSIQNGDSEDSFTDLQCDTLITKAVQLDAVNKDGEVTFQALSDHLKSIFKCWKASNTKT